MEKVIIAVDAGKNSVKVKSDKVKFKFENLVLKDEAVKKPSNELSFEVEVNGERYVVGNKVNTLKDFSSNKIIESNKISIYTAIAEVLDKLGRDNATIQLITGLPNEHYNGKNEEELKKLLGNESISISVNGASKEFTIEDILILPENYSVDYEDIPRTLLLDLGYRNVNLNLLEYGDMIQSFMKHSEKGIVEMKNKVATELEKSYNTHFEIDDVTDHIVTNGLPHNPDSKEIVKAGIVKYFGDLKNEIESKGIKIETINAIALRGGGTKLIKPEYLETIFPAHYSNSAISIEGDEYRNVGIFEEVGLQFFGADA